jgi:hypothetical protein
VNASDAQETFGSRVIGLQISRHGDGMSFERRPVGAAFMLISTVAAADCSNSSTPNCNPISSAWSTMPTAGVPTNN